jgi:hypothetical protein
MMHDMNTILYKINCKEKKEERKNEQRIKIQIERKKNKERNQ